MPGSITNDTAVGILPWSLSASFTENREWPILISEYKDGSSQRQELAGSSRRSYTFGKRLTPAQMTTLRSFYFAHIGGAFKVYVKKPDYDAANNSYILMRFDGAWSEEIQIGRSNISISLIEVA